LELFCSVNILQFIFLALRLDNFILWDWEVVFVPLWILLCVSLVGVLYSIIFAGIIFRAPEVNAEQRRNSTNAAIGYTFLVVPILVFQVSLFLNVSTESACKSGSTDFSSLIVSGTSNQQVGWRYQYKLHGSYFTIVSHLCAISTDVIQQ
jgi:hypothetical protein